jgi:hypothetical protein
MSKDKAQNLQMRSTGVNKSCSNCSDTTFSCEKDTIGFNQPKGRHFTSLDLWRKRDELVEELVNLVNVIKTNTSEAVGSEVKEYFEIRSIISKQREIDPDWHLITARQGEGCLRIIHYNCS